MGSGDELNFPKQVTLQELCRGALEPLRSAIPSEFLSGCQRHEQEDGDKAAVLEHIILDMTGSPVAAEDAGDASIQRTLRRTKRLLRRTNSVLFFRLVIMVLVACMLIVTTLLTWNFTKTFSGQSIKHLSFILRHQILQNSLNSISFVLSQAYTLSLALNAMHQHALLTQGNETWSNIEELQSINWGFFQSERQLSSVGFISQYGHVTDFTRKDNAEYLFFVNNSAPGKKTTWYSQPVTGSLNGSGLQSPSESSAGPYQESFIADSITRHDVVWSIDTAGLQQHTVSSAIPVQNPLTKKILGMSVVTTTLGHLHHYFSTIDLMGGYLYFDWRNASGDSSLLVTSYGNSNDISVKPQQATNTFVAAAAGYLESMYGNVALLNETHADDVNLNGKLCYIDTMPLNNHFKLLNLTAVLIIPRTSIMGEMDARSRTVIKVSVGAAMGILVIGFILICFLTRRMSTEMQLRQELIRQLVAKHKAEQSSNYKSQFLANMSHEMRTPMAGIIGLLDLLACDTLTPDQEISVAQIRRCATGLLSLVNNVLDISKVEAGKMDLEVAPFNVLDELESLVDMFAAQSQGSDVDVTLDLSDEIPRVLRGDAARIRQIFSNLLSNSVKFTARGHILIRGWMDQSLLPVARKSIEIPSQESGDALKGLGNRRSRSTGSESHRESEKIVLVFEVDDTGCGIPMAIQETVFDRFVQADTSTTRIHGGSGLGLYVVRSLVNMMGGDVQIAPKPGPGTRVHFHLVLDQANHPGNATLESCFERPRISVSQDGLSALIGSPGKSFDEVRIPSPELLGRTHVLVALPETITKTVAVHWLERRGVKVTTVNKWDEISTTLYKLCKTASTNCNSLVSAGVQEMKGTSHLCAESPASPFALQSGGSSSCVSEITLEWSRCPVLALIDVALMPSCLPRDQKWKKGIAGLKESFLSRLEPVEMPSDLQVLMDALQQIQVKHDVLVAWVVAPDSGPCLKQALQSVSSSIVLKKPLHCSRMRRLLSLLMDVGKVDHLHSEALSYTSSDPSTPRLTRASSPLKEIGTTYDNLVSKDITAGQEQMYHELDNVLEQDGNLNEDDQVANSFQMESILSAPAKDYTPNILPSMVISKNFPRSSLQERIFVKLTPHGSLGPEDNSSAPESPTSGLITPEGANSMADGVQEVKKDGADAKELENEWKGPIIDLRIATNGKSISKHVRSTYTPEQTSATMSAGESPSTTEPPSPLGSNMFGGGGPGVLASMHILLVEDTPVLQRLASMMLKKLGAEVTVVSDGLQAVEAVAQAVKANERLAAVAEGAHVQLPSCTKFDLILMDCAMPVMDGYSATKTIREAEINTGRHIPIVALTAHALASDEEKCLAVGMDAYLTKPINCKQLVSTVQSLVLRDKYRL